MSRLWTLTPGESPSVYRSLFENIPCHRGARISPNVTTTFARAENPEKPSKPLSRQPRCRGLFRLGPSGGVGRVKATAGSADQQSAGGAVLPPGTRLGFGWRGDAIRVRRARHWRTARLPRRAAHGEILRRPSTQFQTIRALVETPYRRTTAIAPSPPPARDTARDRLRVPLGPSRRCACAGNHRRPGRPASSADPSHAG